MIFRRMDSGGGTRHEPDPDLIWLACRTRPGRVRRDFSQLAALTGTPASPPELSKAARTPQRPYQHPRHQAPRHRESSLTPAQRLKGKFPDRCW